MANYFFKLNLRGEISPNGVPIQTHTYPPLFDKTIRPYLMAIFQHICEELHKLKRKFHQFLIRIMSTVCDAVLLTD